MSDQSKPEWVAPPAWLVKAFEPANEFLDDEEWNDALVLLWGAQLAKGRIRVEHVYGAGREPTGRIRVLVTPLDDA